MRTLFIASLFLAVSLQGATAPDAAPAPSPAPAVSDGNSTEAAHLTPKLPTKAQVAAAAEQPVDPKNPRSWLWEYRLGGFGEKDYRVAVDALFADYERRLGRKLEPGEKRRAGLKVMTNTPGLSTPVALVRAVISALEARGFKPNELFLIDQGESNLRTAGFLPARGESGGDMFGDVPVLVLDRGKYFDLKWNYDSPLPAPDDFAQAHIREANNWTIKPGDRLSLLPVPLLLDVDFWINLPVAMDNNRVSLLGALANASIFAGSNTQRFLQSSASGSTAIAEMSAVPELNRGWVFSIVSLERYQFIGGPRFNSLYTNSEPLLWLSPNPAILDYLLFLRINAARQRQSFPLLDQPAYIEYAKQLDLGDFQPGRVFRVRMP